MFLDRSDSESGRASMLHVLEVDHTGVVEMEVAKAEPDCEDDSEQNQQNDHKLLVNHKVHNLGVGRVPAAARQRLDYRVGGQRPGGSNVSRGRGGELLGGQSADRTHMISNHAGEHDGSSGAHHGQILPDRPTLKRFSHRIDDLLPDWCSGFGSHQGVGVTGADVGRVDEVGVAVAVDVRLDVGKRDDIEIHVETTVALQKEGSDGVAALDEMWKTVVGIKEVRIETLDKLVCQLLIPEHIEPVGMQPLPFGRTASPLVRNRSPLRGEPDLMQNLRKLGKVPGFSLGELH